jgi:hypothetical protein
MKGIRGPLALLGLIVAAGELRAQVIVVPNPYVGPPPGFYFSQSGRRSSVAISIGGYGGNPFFSSPIGYGGGISQVTLVYPPQSVVAQQQPAAAGPRILRLDDLASLDPDLRPDPMPEKPRNPPLPGGREAGVFRPLAPDNRDRAVRPLPPEPAPKPNLPPAPVGNLPRPAPANADPKVEGDEQLKLGREAYAAREYGRATQRFRDAARRMPDDAQPYLLLGQSLFAAGRYPEAVEAIRAGVGLRPDWPNARFAPRDLYGPNVADFTDQMRRLSDALEVLPDDPVLLFLYGYELWFDGRQDEARRLFQRARPASPNPAVIDRFLGPRAVL